MARNNRMEQPGILRRRAAEPSLMWGGFRHLPVFLLALAAVSAAAASSAPQEKPLALSLERAVELGLENDETLRQAGEAIIGAQAEVTKAMATALPQFTLSGQYGRNFLKPAFFLPEEFREDAEAPTKVEIGEDNDFLGSASVSQILWAAGRVRAGLDAARDVLESFRFREEAAADYVRFAVKGAYYRVLLADEIFRIAEKGVKNAEEGVRVARAGYEEGTVSKFDVMRSEVELANRKAPLVRAKNDLDQAMVTLHRRCGLDPAAEVILSDSLQAGYIPGDLETYISVMRGKSAEVQALKFYVEARKQGLRISKAERYPMLQMTAYYGIQTQWSGDFLPNKDLIARNAAVTLGIQIPIFDGLRTKGMISKAGVELRTAELELEKATRDKELAVRQSWLSLENARASLEGRREAVDLAEEAHRLALVRLRNGLATPLERLDAELAMTTARGQLAEALYSCKLAGAYLELAVGSKGFNMVAGTGAVEPQYRVR